MGPGFFSDIGKRARDLLYTDYNTNQKLTLSVASSNNVGIKFCGIKQNELVFGEILSEIMMNKSSIIAIRVNSDSNLVTTVTLNDLMKSGLRGVFSLVVPDQRSGKIELQYLHEYAGLTVTTGLTTNPVVGMSAVFGTSAISFGADVAFDTETSNIMKYNAGMSITTAELIASLTLMNQGDNLNASYYHLVNPTTAVGAEVIHRFSNHTTSIGFGAKYIVDAGTVVKARVNSYGKATALFQHLFPHALISLSAETDLIANDGKCRVGLALALQP